MTDNKYKRILMLGLGGAGQLMLSHVKCQLLERHGEVPLSIKLLSLDTDSNLISIPSVKMKKEVALQGREVMHLRLDQPADFIEADPKVKEWFVASGQGGLGSIINGAGAVRQNGRLALMYNVKEVVERIEQMLTELSSNKLDSDMDAAGFELVGASGPAVDVFICGSLAGGTGSGIARDMGILLRHLAPRALIQGFFLLSWPYRNKTFAFRVAQNAFAALTEIDFHQNVRMEDREASYKVQYGAIKADVKEAPYTLLHLIDGRNEIGENIDDVGELCENIACSIVLSIGSMGQNIQSVIDNLRTHINTTSAKWRGKNARYTSVGMATLYYPAKELRRILAFQNALNLSEELADAVRRSPASETQGANATFTEVTDNVTKVFLETLDIKPAMLREKLCPNPEDVNFVLQQFQYAVSDVGDVAKQAWQGEVTEEKTQCDQLHKRQGEDYLKGTLLPELNTVLAKLDAPNVDNAYKRQWIRCALGLIEDLNSKAAQELDQIQEELTNLEEVLENLLTVLTNTKQKTIFGKGRKEPAKEFSENVTKYLKLIRRYKKIEYEREAYKAIIGVLNAKLPSSEASEDAVKNAFLDVQGRLETGRRVVINELNRVCAKSTEEIIGQGKMVVVPHKDEISVDLVDDFDTFSISLSQFQEQKRIVTTDDVLANKDRLDDMLFDYCNEKLKMLEEDVDIDLALKCFGRNSGDVNAYIERQFGRLVRLASPFINFQRAMMTQEQMAQYAQVLDLGVPDRGTMAKEYEEVLKTAKLNAHIGTQHSCSTVGDPHRIYLLSYSGVIPAYLLTDFAAIKEKYEREMTPTYHTDRELEASIPDLFPEDQLDNKALRVLGMAIVPGIDIVKDTKVGGGQGHTFECGIEKVLETNTGKPLVWTEFLQMYHDCKQPGKKLSPTESPHPNPLLDAIIDALSQKIGAMKNESADRLNEIITDYINRISKEMEVKLNSRRYSKLISVRLIYRELAELRNFITPADRGGYGLDIEAYINGKRS